MATKKALEYFIKSLAPKNIKENFTPMSRDFPSARQARKDVPKKLLKKLGSGVKVYLVDGTFIRNNIDIDFTMGGHEFVYPKYIPKNEIWLDKDISEKEQELTLRHENTERDAMIGGKNYEDAHEIANKEEIGKRKLDRVKKFLQK